MPASVETIVERCHAALLEIVRGNADPWEELLSHGADVSLGNPFGPFVVGIDAVMSAARGAAARYRDGEILGFDRIATHDAGELACVVEVERFSARVGGSNERSAVSLRVTSVFRPEGGEWKLVHRHADPITATRPAESVVSANT